MSEATELVGPTDDLALEVPAAFSIERVLFHGMQVARELPVVVGGAFLAAATVQLLPAAISNVISIAGSVGFPPGSPEAALLSLLSTAIQLFGLMLSVPLVPLFSFGAMAAVALWAAGQPVTFSDVLTGFLPAIRGFLTELLAGLVRGVLAVVFLVPGLVLVGVGVWQSFSVPLIVGGLALAAVYVPIAWFLSVRFALASVAAAVDSTGWPVEAITGSWRGTGSGAGFLTVFVLTLFTCCGETTGAFLGAFLIGIPVLAAFDAVVKSGMALAWMEASRSKADLEQLPYFRRIYGLT